MNTYEIKQEARKQRYLDAAKRAEQESNSAYQASSAAVEHIPFGQPILVGHHSEKAHRGAIRRAQNAMTRSCNASKKAEHYRFKAAGVGTGGISADDPEAVVKLLEKIEVAEARQTLMKAANRIVKSKKLNNEENISKLNEDLNIGYGAQLLEPDFCGRLGFASYELSNNNANIRRMKGRVESLRAAAEIEDKEYSPLDNVDSLLVTHNTDENRIQFYFDGKPSFEIRAIMKSNGFRWAPSQGAWQRQLNQNGIRAGTYAINEIRAL